MENARAEIWSATSHFTYSRGSDTLIGSSSLFLLGMSFSLSLDRSRILVVEFQYSPRILWKLPTAHRFNNSIREEETVIIGSQEPLLAIVREWKINRLSCVARQPDVGTPFGRKQPEKQEGESAPGTS